MTQKPKLRTEDPPPEPDPDPGPILDPQPPEPELPGEPLDLPDEDLL